MQAAMQYAPTEKVVYRAAVNLARRQPEGFDATQLAAQLGCDVAEAQNWLRWLRQTGDFQSESEAARR